MNRPASLFAVLALVACNENGLNNLPGSEGVGGQIEVSPPLIQYGTLQQGEEDTKPFLITNVGTATLLVEELIPGGSQSFTLIDPPSNFMLPVGASETINVLFTPMAANDLLGHVLVLSEDAEDALPLAYRLDRAREAPPQSLRDEARGDPAHEKDRRLASVLRRRPDRKRDRAVFGGGDESREGREKEVEAQRR